MEKASSDFSPWTDLMPDVLGKIFSKLSLYERLNVIPAVCKSWHQQANGPCCWHEIEIEEWSRNHEPGEIDRMVEKLVRISNKSLKKLFVYGVQSQRVLTLIAENAGSLQTLRLPRSNLSDFMMEQFTSNLSMLTSLDVSYCLKIGPLGLETIAKNCKQLEVLRRNMHPTYTFGKPLDDGEAFAIASNMPKLRHLEMTYHLISNIGVLRILLACPHLEHLDLRGCWNANINEINVNEDYPALQILGPIVQDPLYEFEEDLDTSDSDVDQFVED